MDLNAPLGMTPPPRKRRKGPWIAAAVAVLCLGGFGAYLLNADPHGGEPSAVAVIPPPPPIPDSTPTGSIAPRTGNEKQTVDTTQIENGVKVIVPGAPDRVAPQATGPLVIDVSKALDAQARRMAKADSTPPVDNTTAATHTPRVAIFVGGLGLNAAGTDAAIASMPAGVTLAFVPYGDKIQQSVGAARARGHEILLQLPMQSADGTTMGPHTLRADETPAAMESDLSWMMDRFDGFVGVTNLLGAPVTANQTAMTTIMKSVGAHGIFYLDDGTSRRSVATSVAATAGVPVVRADVVLDATADPAVVRANLARLASIARAKGSAIGMASGLSDNLAIVARFAADLDAQGLTLVPVSMIANGGATIAITR